jgi:hypothetical protein
MLSTALFLPKENTGLFPFHEHFKKGCASRQGISLSGGHAITTSDVQTKPPVYFRAYANPTVHVMHPGPGRVWTGQ